MDPFDEFARAIAADNPGKYTVTGTNPEPLKCEMCSKEFAVKRVVLSDGFEKWVCEKCYKEFLDNKDKKKSKEEKFEDYENAYLRRLELTTEEIKKARAEIEIIKIKEPDRQSQKTIPTQETILNAGITLDNCYVILGVDQFITCDELKAQFRKLAVKYNSSIGMLSRTKEENEIMGKVHTKINQAYPELNKAHKCGG